MEQDKETYYYLAKFCTIKQIEQICELLNGENPSVIGTPNRSTFPSTADSFSFLSEKEQKEKENLLKNSAAQVVFQKNAEETSKTATYFYFSTDISELGENLSILAIQPTGEEAITRIQNDNPIMGDRNIDERAACIILKVPESALVAGEKVCNIETRYGEYTNERGELVALQEIACGDNWMRKYCTKENLFALSSIKQIKNHPMWNGTLDNLDLSTNENPNYIPEIVVLPENENTDENSNKNYGYTDDFEDDNLNANRNKSSHKFNPYNDAFNDDYDNFL